MKFAIATVLVIASTASTAALAQDGTGHGPPKKSSVVFVSQTTTTAQAETLTKLFQPKSILASLTK
jgi:hypothetical protein